MAKLVAFEWDAREARFAVGTPKGNEVVVDEAFAIELASDSADESLKIGDIKARIAAALAGKGLTGSEALVAVPRSSVELRTLNLPQAPPEEIPDLVRFQAMQAFTSIGEDWPLDFVELDGHDDSLNVLAAVVPPQLVSQTRDVCAGVDLKEHCLVLRPFAAVSLLSRFETIDIYRSSLVVDLLPEGADLTAISNGHVVFMRSVRLPATSDRLALGNALLGELRRTIGAAQNQMGGSRIEQIVICGDATENQTLQETIARALSLDVLNFNPFEAIRLTRNLQGNLPENPGRYAPLLGMLACHGAGTGHTIDFLNPRKRPAPPSNLLRNLAVVAAVLAVALLGTAFYWSQKKALDDEIAAKTKESSELNAAVEKAQFLMARAERIHEFEKQDITWLDELRQAASKLPDADSLILKKVELQVDPLGAGLMRLQGNVTATDQVAELEESLRYGQNRVEGNSTLSDQSNRDYPYQFQTVVHVPSDVWKDGRSLGRPQIDEEPSTAAPAPTQDEDAVQQDASPAADQPGATPADPAPEDTGAESAQQSPAEGGTEQNEEPPDPSSEPEESSGTGGEMEPKSETENEAEPKSGTENEAEPKSGTENEAEPKSETENEAEPKSGTESKAEQKSETAATAQTGRQLS